MISAIESGGANISIQSVDRIAEALGVSFAQLVLPASGADRRDAGEIVWQGPEAASTGHLLGTSPARKETEYWLWSLGPGDRYDATTPSDGWHEMVYVLEGTLVIELGDGEGSVKQGEFRTFSPPASFAFANNGSTPVRFLRCVSS